MNTTKKEIEELTECIQTKLGHSCDINYFNEKAISVENWESCYMTELSKTDCYFLSMAFMKLANLLETPNVN